ncbi:hypothetical protein Y032_0011g1496 [Ancylostoma ceylanicum]|uniref:Uncharacterized protein n=1 Tax=Ancylostoma ceylanicum TaxID=53326 RepID=A0A016VGW6_9BILA|nr:hypothetical protein Y032_0011g1496 [Ancylostoma ceylanicum]
MLSGRPSFSFDVTLPVWREDSVPTRRRLALIVRPYMRQFALTPNANEEESVQHEAGDRRLEVTWLLLNSTQMRSMRIVPLRYRGVHGVRPGVEVASHIRERADLFQPFKSLVEGLRANGFGSLHVAFVLSLQLYQLSLL